jgi:2-oxoglutarate ferredoxin oxidoreductase subunit alpha
MKTNDLTWMIGGEAGFGVQSAGHYFALTCSRGGLSVFGNAEYPSLIRGGHNSNVIRVADFEVAVHKEILDLLLAMNKETLDLHAKELAEGGGAIYDADVIKDYVFPAGVKAYAVPLKKIAMEVGRGDITRNTVGLGASLALLGYGLEIYLEILKEAFAGKGEKVVNNNVAAARAGFDYVTANYKVNEFGFKLKVVEGAPRRLLLTGNDAAGIAALKAGVKFVAEYPMTPSSSFLHFMSNVTKDYNVIVKHTEDELAAMNMVVGASWAGVRAITATSGGGFSLMTEGLGMAGMIEAPIVCYEVMRGGPSTGLPTRTEQSDLRFVMHASQGEFPRLVVAPGDYNELFYKTFEAFNIAEKYQMPALILSDKHLAETIKTVEPYDMKDLKVDRGWLVRDEAEVARLKANGYNTVDDGFLRYKFEENGVSPRILPGTKGGRHRAATDEHDETGDLTETEENRTLMQAKRMRKLEFCLKDLPAPVLVGPGKNGAFVAGPAYAPEEADITLVTWGSPKDALLEVVQMLKREGIKANLLQITYFIPFHTEEIRTILSKCKFKVGVEMNYEGQMCGAIAEKTGIFMDKKILKWSGRQFTAHELYDKIRASFTES